MDTRTAAPAAKAVEPFYRSSEWRQLRAAVVAERGHRCEDCGRADGRLYADHVVELQDGGAALDVANLRVRCASCHTSKTIRTQAERMLRTPPHPGT
jgi:5-methylcytosine-specific restriction endonuclease McrA